MTDCSKIPTLALVEESKKAMEDNTTFIKTESNEFKDYTGNDRISLKGIENLALDVISKSSNNLPTKIPTVPYGSGFITVNPLSPDEYPVNQGVRIIQGDEGVIVRFAGEVSELPYDMSQPYDESKWVNANVATTSNVFTVKPSSGQMVFGPFSVQGEEVEIQGISVFVNGKRQIDYAQNQLLGSFQVIGSRSQVQLIGWTASEDDVFEFEVNAIKSVPLVNTNLVSDILEYTVGGLGVDITPELQQAILDSYNGIKPSTIVIPSGFYGELRSKSNLSSTIAMYPGVKILMLPNCRIKNFVAAHMFRTEQSFPAGSDGWYIEGDRSSIIDHNSQAIDDLASNQLALVDQGDQDLGPQNPGKTPNSVKKYSGYGNELYNGVFPTLAHYDGWPFGSPQVTQSYHCIWPENTKRSVINGFTVRRSHKTSVRGSNTEDLEILNIYCDEPRSVGINISDNCINPRVLYPYVYSCLQIGIAVFDVDNGTTRGGIYGARCIQDPNRPLGENGIEILGNYPFENTIFEMVGFQSHGYGSHGVRLVNTSSVVVSGGIVTNVGKLAVQVARYPGVTDGTGIGVRESGGGASRENTIADCVIKNCNNFELVVDNVDNTIDNVQVSATLGSSSDGRAEIGDIAYSNVSVLNLNADGSADMPAWSYTAAPLLGFYRSGADLSAMHSAEGVCARWGQGELIAGGTAAINDLMDKGFLHIPLRVGTQFLEPANNFGGQVTLSYSRDRKALEVYDAGDNLIHQFNQDSERTPDV